MSVAIKTKWELLKTGAYHRKQTRTASKTSVLIRDFEDAMVSTGKLFELKEELKSTSAETFVIAWE